MTATGQLEALRGPLNKLAVAWRGAHPNKTTASGLGKLEPISWKAVIEAIEDLMDEWQFIEKMETDPAPHIALRDSDRKQHINRYHGNLALKK